MMKNNFFWASWVKLPDYFIRTHNSYVINLFHAVSIHNGSIIKLNNSDEIPISQRKKKEVFESVLKV
jgi:DNA-binding LytR/AlgR family response regulator